MKLRLSIGRKNAQEAQNSSPIIAHYAPLRGYITWLGFGLAPLRGNRPIG
jgi:hypothetical protein